MQSDISQYDHMQSAKPCRRCSSGFTRSAFAKSGFMRSGFTRCFTGSGFTLVELVVTLAIMAILVLIALPSFSTTLANYRARSFATDLYVALIKTRSEAIKRNADVQISPAEDGWQSGWVITPADNDSNIIDSSTGRAGVTVTGLSDVKYNSAGRASQTGSFSIEAEAGGVAVVHCVTIGLSGLPSQKASEC